MLVIVIDRLRLLRMVTRSGLLLQLTLAEYVN